MEITFNGEKKKNHERAEVKYYNFRRADHENTDDTQE